MKLFQTDSPFMIFMNKLTDLVLINIYTVLLCVPIVTAGAAFTALHYCCLKIVRNEDGSITKQYFRSFKDNFKQSSLLWLIQFIIIAFLVFDFYYLFSNPSETTAFIMGALFVVTFIFLFVSTMLYPIQAKFINSIGGTIKSAFYYSFRHFGATFLSLLAYIIIFAIGYYFMIILPIVLCFCFSAPALLSALFYNKVFKAIEDDYRKTHNIPDPSENDEHIFSDKPLDDEAISEENK